MEKTDIFIIGGGPAGIVTALTAKVNYPDKKITLAREKENSLIPCAIPYIFYSLEKVEKDIIPDEILLKNGIELLVDRVKKIDTTNKKAILSKGKSIGFEKLVLATGSKPTLIPISGIEKEGVWLIEKDISYLKKFKEAVLRAKDIVIIGGGFIGVEISDELSQKGDKNITIVEKSEHCLSKSFDDEFAVEGEEILKQRGVNILTGVVVEKILGKKQAEKVKLSNGKEIKADLVILSIGAKPNIDLLEGTEIKKGDYGGIWVDEYMRTSIKDIFAVGDCAETKDFFTGKSIPVMLASTACTEARIAGANLYELRLLRENKGTLGSFSTKVGDLTIGISGYNEKSAKREKFDYIIGKAEVANHHPAVLPGAKKIKLKLLFSRKSGILLGGEVSGPEAVSEMVNIISLAIQKEVDISNFDTLQISTHPFLTSSPTAYPLIKAAQMALSQIK
ncbi:MAG: pyridine nucleotide-disulfide oxidoreductase [Thermoplasmata archaeon]|nr:MAG: pyridine nucleotide-disulfide oxidoreductase [Thermoplasmata archaeon]